MKTTMTFEEALKILELKTCCNSDSCSRRTCDYCVYHVGDKKLNTAIKIVLQHIRCAQSRTGHSHKKDNGAKDGQKGTYAANPPNQKKGERHGERYDKKVNCCKNCGNHGNYDGWNDFFCEYFRCYMRAEHYDCEGFTKKHNE